MRSAKLKECCTREFLFSVVLSFLVSIVVVVVDQALQYHYHAKQFLICDDFFKTDDLMEKRVTKTTTAAANFTKDHL